MHIPLSKSFLLLTLYVICNCKQTEAQSLFTYLTDEESNFTSTELLKLDSLRADTTYDTIYVVQVHDVWDVQDGGFLPINLPGHGTIDAMVTDVETTPAVPHTEYNWSGIFYGELLNDDDELVMDYDGQVFLFKKNGEIYGTIHAFNSDDIYRLESVGPGKNILYKYNVETVSNFNVCDVTANNPTAATTSGDCPVKVLAVATQKADILSGMLAGASLNQVFNESLTLAQKAVRNSTGDYSNPIFEAAYPTVIILNDGTFHEGIGGTYPSTDPNYPNYVNMANDVIALKNNATVQYLRDIYKADVVICFGAGYPDVQGKSAAIGPEDGEAYAIVNPQYASPTFTFAHELGHLMGGRHQQNSVCLSILSDDAPGYDHGYRFKKGSRYYGDIMHTIHLSHSRMLIYSTPTVKIGGKEIGTANNDVARTLLDNQCTVGDFRQEGADYSLKGRISPSIVGLHSTNSTVNLVGEGIQGIPNYTYDWYLSSDGGNNYTHLSQSVSSTGSPFSFTMPSSPNAIVFLKITDAVNNVIMVPKTIWNTNFNAPAPPYGPSNNGNKQAPSIVTSDVYLLQTQEQHIELINEVAPLEFSISPNPVKHKINIDVNIPNFKEGSSLIITDILGRVVIEHTLQSAQESWRYDVQDLEGGVYCVRLSVPGISSVKKFTITK